MLGEGELDIALALIEKIQQRRHQHEDFDKLAYCCWRITRLQVHTETALALCNSQKYQTLETQLTTHHRQTNDLFSEGDQAAFLTLGKAIADQTTTTDAFIKNFNTLNKFLSFADSEEIALELIGTLSKAHLVSIFNTYYLLLHGFNDSPSRCGHPYDVARVAILQKLIDPQAEDRSTACTLLNNVISDRGMLSDLLLFFQKCIESKKHHNVAETLWLLFYENMISTPKLIAFLHLEFFSAAFEKRPYHLPAFLSDAQNRSLYKLIVESQPTEIDQRINRLVLNSIKNWEQLGHRLTLKNCAPTVCLVFASDPQALVSVLSNGGGYTVPLNQLTTFFKACTAARIPGTILLEALQGTVFSTEVIPNLVMVLDDIPTIAKILWPLLTDRKTECFLEIMTPLLTHAANKSLGETAPPHQIANYLNHAFFQCPDLQTIPGVMLHILFSSSDSRERLFRVMNEAITLASNSVATDAAVFTQKNLFMMLPTPSHLTNGDVLSIYRDSGWNTVMPSYLLRGLYGLVQPDSTVELSENWGRLKVLAEAYPHGAASQTLWTSFRRDFREEISLVIAPM